MPRNKPIAAGLKSMIPRIPIQSQPTVQEMGMRGTQLGTALYIRVFTHDYRRLGWEEVWRAFTDRYPGMWALEVYPPESEIVNEQNIYHLWVYPDEPVGMNIRKR